MLEATLRPLSALADLPRPTQDPDRFMAGEQEESICLSVIGRPGRETELARRLHDRFGIELSSVPRRVPSPDGVAFVGIGPQSWLAIATGETKNWFGQLREALDGLASVTEQSSGYTRLRMAGSEVAAVLSRVLPIDLHERAFKVNDVACTASHHISIILWRVDDATDRKLQFEMLIPRSYTGSFWRELLESAAELGSTGSDRTS